MAEKVATKLDELIALARSSTREAFAAKLPHLFLALGAPPKTEVPVFATQIVAATPNARPRAGHAGAASLDVVAVTKAPDSPYPDRISIGRARNCDVVIRDSSVSKLHAQFVMGAGSKLELCDSSSQNGTAVNGQALSPGVPVQVAPGDSIRLGSLTCHLIDATGLYDLLHRTAPHGRL